MPDHLESMRKEVSDQNRASFFKLHNLAGDRCQWNCVVLQIAFLFAICSWELPVMWEVLHARSWEALPTPTNCETGAERANCMMSNMISAKQ